MQTNVYKRKILGLLVLSASIVFSTSCAAAPEQQVADPASSTEAVQTAEATQEEESESYSILSVRDAVSKISSFRCPTPR